MKSLFLVAGALSAVALSGVLAAEPGQVNRATFNADGKVQIPENWREWVYIGAPVTPNALNGGEAPFPEFHSVYVEPSAYRHYAETGEWAEATQIVKELNRIISEDAFEDGSIAQVSGIGYFMGEFSGLELTVKDTERFKDMPGGWAYFAFGHHAPPYAQTAAAVPAQDCNACHEANAADDFVFTQFYPVLQALKP
jgi:hypothetical protein